ncbi:MAG: phage tail protein, partial [Nitrospirota bacterium]|nr:phage tail protein [Nitrospirota bacterium]
MPEYLSPGVYVEEFEIGAKPIEGVGTSTVGILGMTERGPLKPRLVTSFTQFSRLFGSYTSNSLTAYAVDSFFSNGGQRCFIGRVARSGADSADLTIDPLDISSVGPGAWGNRVAVRVENSSSGDANQFKLVVAYWSGTLPSLAESGATDEERRRNLRALLDSATMVEVFDNLSTSSTSQDHYLKRVNGISGLIEIAEPANANRPANTGGAFMAALVNGDDGAASLTRDDMRGDPAALPGARTGLTAFTEVDEIAILYAPDMYSSIFDAAGRTSLVDDILTHCETLKDRFAILDVPSGTADISGLTLSAAPLRPSKYGAVYYPW